MSQPQIVIIPKKFEDFFACRILLDADHQQPGNIQRLFRLQICLSRRSSIPRKHSKTFSPAELSQPQIIDTPKTFKDFFACRILLDADHQQPGNIQRFFFTCRIVLAANDQQHGNIQIFSTSRTLLAANHQQPGNSQRHFHRQKYLSLKLSTTWKHSKFFSTAEMSQPQIVIIPKKIKDFLACRTVLAADHRYPENMQTVFHLQVCLGRKSLLSRKHSKTFSPAEFSQTQIINNLEIFKDFFTCRIVLAANHHYDEKIQRVFLLQNCLSRRPSIPRKYANSFSPADMSWPQINHYPENIQRFFRLQNCLSRRSSMPRKYSNTFSPADMS